MTVTTGDILRVTARYTLGDSQIAENVFYAEFEGATISDTAAEEDLAFWIDTIFTEWEGVQSTSVLPLDILIFHVTDNRPMSTQAFSAYAGGTVANQQMAPGVAAVVTALTGISRVFGRKYVGGLDEDEWNGTTLVAGAISLLAAGAVFWISDFQGDTSTETWQPGVLRTGGTFAPFSEAFVRAEPGYQRRRRAGVGI